MADLATTIETEAGLPQSSTADGQSATARSIPDLIKADQYLAQKTANRSRRRGIMFGVITTPGALDDSDRLGGGFNSPCGGC